MTFIFLAAFQIALLQNVQPQPDIKTTVADIKKVWAETETKTDSCRFQWSESRQAGNKGGGGFGGGGFDAANYIYSLFIEDADHLRIERIATRFDSDRGRNINETYVSTFNSEVDRSFYGRDVVDDEIYPTGFVSFKPSDWDNFHVLPILMAVRPINDHYSPINEQEYSVAKAAVDVADRKLLVLKPAKPKAEGPNTQYIYYVDPERDFSISRIIAKWGEEILWQLDISHRLDVESDCWIPESWSCSGESTTFEVENVEAELNVRFANDQFSFRFPTHTVVNDRTFTAPLVYFLRNDRRRRIVTPEERRAGIKYLSYLAADRLEAGKDRP